MADLTGRIVFQPFVGSRDWLAQVKYLQEQGAVAILYGTASCKCSGQLPFRMQVDSGAILGILTE
jgi:hypothetical protein